MYSTCTFCHASLGANEALERFPVGRRLAFDPEKGRLWVVCARCLQWNLSPLEERWEAIEDAERLFRDTRLRASTDQVGLARMRDGTDLVRIGRPLLPEFASWRYGPRFGVRLRRNLGLTIGGAALVGGSIVWGPALGLAAGGAGLLPFQAAHLLYELFARFRVVARLEDSRGPILLGGAHIRGIRLAAVDWDPRGWRLMVPHLRGDTKLGWPMRAEPKETDEAVTISGDAAVFAARSLLPLVNASGGMPHQVRRAVDLLEDTGSLDASFKHALRFARGNVRQQIEFRLMPVAVRIALEMAAHEETERRAMEGELADLERRWAEAEAVAAIADSLTVPQRIMDRIARLGGR